MAHEHRLTLAMTRGIGPVLIRRLIDLTGDAPAACAATAAELRHVEGIGTARAATLREALRRAAEDARQELTRARHAGVTLLCPDDTDYPPLLRLIPDPPPVLYLRGTLEPRDLNAIAIVGSRRCSHYGREQAQRFGALLAGAGFTVISGGARGVDSAAHRGALDASLGRTLAVLGCGIDITYPPENQSLFRQVADRGALITEYPMGTPPLQSNFPQRNRIVSGMSRGVLVVEADERSGALITARLAADDHNRPVFALPGRIDNDQSAGPHRLIRDGAILVRHLQDLLDGLDPLPQPVDQAALFPQRPAPPDAPSLPSDPPPAALAPALTAQQQALLNQMDAQPVAVDTLVQRTDLDAAIVLRELTFLSLKGLIRRVEGQTYARR